LGEQRADEIARRRIPATKKNPKDGEIEESYQEVRALVELHEDPSKKDTYDKHPVLPGVTRRSGERINAIVALRIDGYRDKDIVKLLDIPQPEPHRLERTHPKAFAAAETHLLRQVERKYMINLWSVRAALSDAGPRMVKVLVDLAEDSNLKENVRKDSAIAVLNLMGAGYTRTSVGGRDSELKTGAANVFIQNIVDKEKEYAETIDAEIVEEEIP